MNNYITKETKKLIRLRIKLLNKIHSKLEDKKTLSYDDKSDIKKMFELDTKIENQIEHIKDNNSFKFEDELYSYIEIEFSFDTDDKVEESNEEVEFSFDND